MLLEDFISSLVAGLIDWSQLNIILPYTLQDSEDYKELIEKCHLRSAQAIVSGSLLNGGLYIKLCQGLAAVNHILPNTYTETLIVLQDQVVKFIFQICPSLSIC
jgi:predicted unusual protein kinase regulating ubiquinone biosynthesis (AarF/ABC1/UbiB family)